MSGQQDFYLQRAAEARRDADATNLDNVRERCLRSEAAWTQMALRAGRAAKGRTDAQANSDARALLDPDDDEDTSV